MLPSKEELAKKIVKKSTADEDGRRRREANLVKIRKEKRDEGLQKRRMMMASVAGVGAEGPTGAGASSTTSTSSYASLLEDININNLQTYCEGGSIAWDTSASADTGAPANGRRSPLPNSRQAQPESRAESLTHPRPVSAAPSILPRPPPTLAAALSSSESDQTVGVSAIRRLLSKETSPPVEAVLATGILARLVALLDATDPKLAFEAAWAVTNIASTDYTRFVVDSGAIAPLVRCMASPDHNVREQAIWCCGNIAGDCAAYRDSIINTEGALDALLRNIQFPESPSLLRNATWALSNLCRGKPAPSEAAVRYVLPALTYLVTAEAEAEVTADAAWGFSYLTDCDRTIVGAVVEAGVVKRFVDLMAQDDLTILLPALRTVGNLIAGEEDHTTAVLECGALRHLSKLLTHPRRNVRREAAWAVSNVAAGTAVQIEALMAEPGLMANVVQQLRTGEWNVRKEATWVISNIAATGSVAHLRTLMSLGIVEPLSDMLSPKASDVRVLSVVLDTISALLGIGAKLAPRGTSASVVDRFEAAGLLDSLERLQELNNDDIYDKCVDIIDKYFGAESNEDAAPGNSGATAAPAPFGASAFGGFGGSSFGAFSSGNAMPWATGFMTPPSAHAAASMSAAPPTPSCAPGMGAPAATSAPATGGFSFGKFM
jgi:importin subunit alpha-1